MKINKIYIPLIISIAIIIGMWMGKLISTNKPITMISLPNSNGSGKLESLINHIKSSYVDTVNIEKITNQVITEVLTNLDPHSSYLPKENHQIANENINGHFEGIGISFRLNKDTIMVVSTITGGPSEKLGLLSGDRIIKINDSLVAGVGISTRKVMSLLKGKKNTTVALSIARRKFNKLFEFNIVRDKIPLYTVYAPYMLTKDIAYLKITQFGRSTYQEFIEALRTLAKDNPKHLVIDLRGNGGGLLQSAITILDELTLRGKLLLYTSGVNRKRVDFFSRKDGKLSALPITILIDDGSASASEILAGAVQDNDRGVIIGRRSFGKGLVQEQIPYSDGSAIRLTVARYYTPSGRCIQKPYSVGNLEDYYSEASSRYKGGELFSSDSIPVTDSVKYFTKILKRPVFAKGGVTPDIFVPLDTLGYNRQLRDLIYSGALISFVNEFVDNNRSELKETYKDGVDFSNKFNQQETLKAFKKFLKKSAAFKKLNMTAIKGESMKKLKQRIIFYTVKELFGATEFYKVQHLSDATITKAKEVIKASLLTPNSRNGFVYVRKKD